MAIVNQSIRLKILILPISLVVAVVISVFYVKPYYAEMASAKTALSEKQGQLAELKKQNEKLQQIKTEWEALGEEKTLVQTALPETESVDTYVSEIASKASRSGVLLSDIKLDQQNSGGNIYSYVCGANSSEVSGTTTSGAELSGSGSSPVGVGSSNCLEAVGVTLGATGTWEQILDFFKYLEDMNRISNIRDASIASRVQSQDEIASDLLTVNVSANIFCKKENRTGSLASVTGMVKQDGFNKEALEKVKRVVYSIYDAPTVSPVGERNIFKK